MLYYVGGMQWMCWVHLLSVLNGKAIPPEIKATVTYGVPNNQTINHSHGMERDPAR